MILGPLSRNVNRRWRLSTCFYLLKAVLCFVATISASTIVVSRLVSCRTKASLQTFVAGEILLLLKPGLTCKFVPQREN